MTISVTKPLEILLCFPDGSTQVFLCWRKAEVLSWGLPPWSGHPGAARRGCAQGSSPQQEPAKGPDEPAESGDTGPAAPQNHQQRLEHIVRRAAVEDKVRGGGQLSAVRSEGPLPISGLCDVSLGCFCCSHLAMKPPRPLCSLRLGTSVPGEGEPAAHPLKAPAVGTGDVAVPSAQTPSGCSWGGQWGAAGAAPGTNWAPWGSPGPVPPPLVLG